MSADLTPALGLPLLAAAQSQKHVTMNEALLMLDAVLHLLAVSATSPTPPASPLPGVRHIVPPAATGAWSGHAEKVAVWQDDAWLLLAAKPGWLAWITDEARHRVFDGTAWRPLTSAFGVIEQWSIGGAASSPATRLAVSSSQTLLNHDGGSHRIAINKKAQADTASIIFQTDFTGAVEVGTAGNNDLVVKTSTTSGQWNDRLVVKRATGNVGIGIGEPTIAGAGRVLHVHAEDAPTDRSVIHCTVGNRSGAAEGMLVGNLGGAAGIWNYENDSILFGTGGDTRMVILSEGDVGIGVSSPTCRLHADGAVRTGSSTVASMPNAAATGAGALLYVPDAQGGGIHAFSDGAIWRRVDTRAALT